MSDVNNVEEFFAEKREDFKNRVRLFCDDNSINHKHVSFEEQGRDVRVVLSTELSKSEIMKLTELCQDLAAEMLREQEEEELYE